MLGLQQQLQNAAKLMQQVHRIVALTGAGISTESGIPDFRSPGSLWQQQPSVSYQDFTTETPYGSSRGVLLSFLFKQTLSSTLYMFEEGIGHEPPLG